MSVVLTDEPSSTSDDDCSPGGIGDKRGSGRCGMELRRKAGWDGFVRTDTLWKAKQME
jgi:hypothetical protein